jgi:putative ABC transport system substrate-binding protein
MRRREFIALLGGAASAWPLAARAQQSGRLPTIGYMGVAPSRAPAFMQRLRELGWIEGRTIAIEFRWGSSERSAEIVADLVRLKADVIVADGTLAALAQ